MSNHIERLDQLGIQLHRPRRVIGYFDLGVEYCGLLYLAGTYGAAVDAHDKDFWQIAGKLGDQVSFEHG